MQKIFILITSILIISCNSREDKENVSVNNNVTIPRYLGFTIIDSFLHDSTNFTQGLVIFKNHIFESTGDFDNSRLIKKEEETRQKLRQVKSGSENIFGEGITVFKDTIYQLTWQNNVVYLYDVNNLNKIEKSFKWSREGWGITNDNEHFYISDGSSNIYIVNPKNFEIEKVLNVSLAGNPLSQLNELELIDNKIFANVWHEGFIVVINKDNGIVEKIIDLKEITSYNRMNNSENVLNGIAYNKRTNNLLITGKNWKKFYLLKLQ